MDLPQKKKTSQVLSLIFFRSLGHAPFISNSLSLTSGGLGEKVYIKAIAPLYVLVCWICVLISIRMPQCIVQSLMFEFAVIGHRYWTELASVQLQNNILSDWAKRLGMKMQMKKKSQKETATTVAIPRLPLNLLEALSLESGQSATLQAAAKNLAGQTAPGSISSQSPTGEVKGTASVGSVSMDQWTKLPSCTAAATSSRTCRRSATEKNKKKAAEVLVEILLATSRSCTWKV